MNNDDPYVAEIRKLMNQAEQLLRAEWPKATFDTYNLAACARAMIEHKEHKGQQRRRPITSLEASAKKFLAELAKHRAVLLESASPLLIEHGYYESALNEIDAAHRAAAVFLEKPQPFNIAQEMGQRLIDTCARAGVQLSPGTKQDDPYCRIVTRLLALGGLHLGEWTVSDFLRGRAQRARTGRRQSFGARP
jgi:hypothetical protein